MPRSAGGERPALRKLTITVDEDVDEGLHARVGRRRISRFLNDLARPLAAGADLDAGYEAKARDEVREDQAEKWIDDLIGVADRAVRITAPW